ncbi:4'-phosphopantetheinyl transferase superfamily protein [Nocardiopsis sp. NPDC006198]|uniref:4'-phosphopantetheinyl transferase family protein n=1 Tax=Nocardiopsis sp. NPDC006198 TaxID=3154472 RepID=UPI0033BEEFD9
MRQPPDPHTAAIAIGIIPEFVQWVETTVHVDEALFDEERAYLSRAVTVRRREFTTARACVRRALAPFWLDRPPMVPGVGGAPPWPDSVVGSTTHTDGYSAAAVASVERARSIGIDAEPDDALPDGVLELITDQWERDYHCSLGRGSAGTAWDRLVFSAKESVSKIQGQGPSRAPPYAGTPRKLVPAPAG